MLSKILGFGDYVPGQASGDPNAPYKLVGDSIYVFIGMATIAMSFDLMQEEIIAKCMWLGKKLGVIDQENPDEANNFNEINNIKKDIPNSYEPTSNSSRLSYNENYPNSRVSSTEPLQRTEISSKPRSAFLQNMPSRIQSKK